MRLRNVTTAALIATISATVQLHLPAAGQPTDVDAQLTEELKHAEQLFWTASRDHDAEGLDRFAAPEFTLRSAVMRQQGLPRVVWMDNTVNKLKDAWFELRYVAARKLAEDLAVVGVVHDSKGTINGRDMNRNCPCYGIDFWRKHGGYWQIVGRYAMGRAGKPDAGSQPRPPAGDTSALTDRDVDPQFTETLRELEQELVRATLRSVSDPKAVDRLVASEFTIRTSDAPEKSVPRSSWIQTLRSGKLVSVEEQYHAARKLADDVAVVSLVMTQHAAAGNPDQSSSSYVVDIWKKRTSLWQLIARYSGKTVEAVSR
jgi:uncharacterized protein DUF4440